MKTYKGWRHMPVKGSIYDVLQPGDTVFFGPGNHPHKVMGFVTKLFLPLIRMFSHSKFHHVVKCITVGKRKSDFMFYSVEPPKAKSIGYKQIKNQGLILIRRPISKLSAVMVEKMRILWESKMQGVSYDEGQLLNMMFHKLLGFSEAEKKHFHIFEEGSAERVCSVGVALLDRYALGFDPVPGVDVDLIDPGMLERTNMYYHVALCRGEDLIKVY